MGGSLYGFFAAVSLSLCECGGLFPLAGFAFAEPGLVTLSCRWGTPHGLSGLPKLIIIGGSADALLSLFVGF